MKILNKEEYKNIVKEEGDYMEFEYFGFPCVIKRIEGSGHWCGYVGVPKHSRLNEKNYYYSSGSELGLSKLEEAINNIDVHGGLTFAGKLKEKEGDSTYYFGFDCAHSGDLVEYYFDYPKFLSNIFYRNKDYVIEECKKLALQLKGIIDLGI